ncbi:hypothetical protein [Massilia rubra]|uniref:Uncharacterized protein n=1 Tax=Massilia rubra TaxID=2607910 RepID=A0ABX0LQE6_9BURK|nr:hypothetical protein [Massilia rubra]NHZ36974.1 hypothetical protein [Massilia rubra]
MKKALLLVLVAVIVGGVLFARVYKENRRSIDCGMQANTVAGIALRRDKGATRDEVRAAMSGTDLKTRSAAQVESMLDAVYVHGTGKSFEEIRNIAWEQCDKNPER